MSYIRHRPSTQDAGEPLACCFAKRIKPKQARQPTQAPIHKWTEHIQSHFRGGQGAALLPAEPDLLVLASERSAVQSLPSLDGIEYEVRQALRSTQGYPGEDGVEAATSMPQSGLARDRRQSLQEHLLVPVFVRLFEAVFKSRRVPAAWKAGAYHQERGPYPGKHLPHDPALFLLPVRFCCKISLCTK
jgi:hypothetical protein